ncbi:CU044_5270 family protein [Cellulomonas sp. JH27-2]|uniref:CU044_5270 family protein n=1 Tax=Cellulomonas sp. JH27-2 TaxID=2774139 RepID=UPI00178211E4|nr:CU044_5270 family protein [Cellulomonas sp. JH27-2]MBD8059302.1 CU044_5270 family protein [Cellulomonas sp. JH27-2]
MTAFERAQAEVDALTALLLENGIEPRDVAPDAAPEAGPAEVSAADRLLLDAILAGETTAAPAPGRSRLVRRRVIQLAAVACAALVVLTSSTVLGTRHDAAVAGPPALMTYGSSSLAEVYAGTAPSASSALLKLADVADAQPPIATEGDQEVRAYAWYSSGAEVDGVDQKVVEPVTEKNVLRPDGSATTSQDRSSGLDVNGKVVDRRVDRATGKVTGDDLPPGTFDPAWVRNLPRDVDGMRAALLDRIGGPEACSGKDGGLDVAGCLSSELTGDVTSFWVVPPDVSATMWRTFAAEKDVYLLGDTTDRVGRKGVAVAVMEPATPDYTRADVLIISPTTGQLLSWEWLDEDPAAKGGADVAAFRAITSARYVP